MGTFTGHLAPSLAFTFLGLWHLLNTTKSSTTTTTTWFPSPILKHLELHLILSLSLLAILLQLLPSPSLLSPLPLEHATMFLHLAIYALSAIAFDLVSPDPAASSGLSSALAASAFAQELFLLHFHSADHAGLEGHYHLLLQLTVAASIAFTVLAAASPSGGFAVARSAAVTCQGVWFGVMGFVLWGPRAAPDGCRRGGEAAVECATEAAARRAVAMANLQFSWMVAGVSVLTACLCLRPGWKWMEYRRLEDRGDGAKQTPQCSEV